MARKRSNKNSPRDKAVTKIDRSKAMPLQQNEAYLLKELVDQSNSYGQLLTQFEKYEFALQDLIWKRKEMQKGNIKLPILLPFAGSSFYSVDDKKKVMEDLETQIKQLTNARDGIDGQMKHRRDEFIETGLRLRTFMDGRFGAYTSTTISVPNQTTGVRVKAGKDVQKKDEQELFKAEFDDIMKSPALKEEFKEASKKAVELNKKQSK